MSQDQKIEVPAWHFPFIRHKIAMQFKVDKKFAFVTYGGLGDVLCCEPTIRYTEEFLKPTMKLESITVITKFPQLFKHLNVECLQIDSSGKMDIEDGVKKYHFLYCGVPEGDLQNCFFTHNAMLPVDYPAIASIKTQLPLNYRYIKTSLERPNVEIPEKAVVIHPGNHWESKRFPKKWWDEILNLLIHAYGVTPVLIGGTPGGALGTVEVNPEHCIDLREKISVAESAYILNGASVLLTNDSFPLHLATTGHCHIGFFGTAKNPEWLYHWRNNTENKVEFAWRMENLALGGSYQRTYSTTSTGNLLAKASPTEIINWLPEPSSVVRWVIEKIT